MLRVHLRDKRSGQAIEDAVESKADELRKTFRILVRGVRHLQCLPSSYYLRKVRILSSDHDGRYHGPAEHGAFGDIYKGKWKKTSVALKTYRSVGAAESQRTFLREIVVWRQLRHPHIQPFLGVSNTVPDLGGRLVIVSRWEDHRSLRHALSAFKEDQLWDCRPKWVRNLSGSSNKPALSRLYS